MKSGQDNEIVISIDGGKWFQKKVSKLLKESCVQNPTQVPILPVAGWNTFPSCRIPESFCYGIIHEHIIETAVLYDSDGDQNITDFGTSKPMAKGRQYFTSGHVKNIQDTAQHNYYFLKSTVMSSYDTKKVRNVSLTLDMSTAKVMDASCDCEASSMSRCNHVAALLFALEDYTLNFGYEPPSKTSQLCGWNKGRKSKRDPKACHSVAYAKKLKSDRIIKHDPRPENFKLDTELFVNQFIATLPNACENSMFANLLEIRYNDYEIDVKTLTAVTENAIETMKSTIINCNNTPFEVENTKGQASSDTWRNQRVLKITASNAKAVSSTQSKRGQYALLNRLLWDKTLIDLKGLKYGRENEKNAFIEVRSRLPTGMEVIESGFWVNPKYPELGCTPDGLILDNHKNMIGVLEIKCPFVLEKFDPLCIELLQKSQKNNLCYTIDNGNISIKKNHSYYYQVQMQIFICDVQFCDFVIWSPKGCGIQRIFRDDDFWDKLRPKLIDFHHNVLLPEYFEMRIPRRLLPIKLGDM